MSSEPVTIPFFLDNWAYLKTELNWLDRVLMVSISRQRKEEQGVARVAKTAADRVSSHWWQGMISLDGGKAAYDEHRPATKESNQNPSGRYQQQLEARIRASQQQGIVLALPLLCDRLNLTMTEKNLILMALAPEVNRRYGQLYRFLQGDSDSSASDLPTVDLALRLLCRNDAEWRTARLRLSQTSPLVQQKLVRYIPTTADTLLSQRIQLAPVLVDFLLAESPDPQALETILAEFCEPQPSPLWSSHLTSTSWENLVLPQTLLEELQQLCRGLDVDSVLFDSFKENTPKGTVALLGGLPGTGKRLAAQAIAQQLALPLAELDLAILPADRYGEVLHALERDQPPVLLVRHAEAWLRRSTPLSAEILQRWLNQRQEHPSITLLSVTHLESVGLNWKRQIKRLCYFPAPGVGDRQLLWQRAFSSIQPQTDLIDWSILARQFPLTGGQIEAIAQSALRHLAIAGDPQLTYDHLATALQEHGLQLVLPKPKKRSRRKQR